jgi:hypothetical protein
MARIRTIKPDFWTDEKLTECSITARLFFVGTWNFADDNGNLVRSAKKLKMQVFPADMIDCEPLIQELMAIGLLIEYSVGAEKFLHIKGFKKHQVINRPSKSSIPQPPFTEENEVLPDDSVSLQGELTDGREGKGKEEEGKGSSVPNGTGGEPPSGQSETAKDPAQMTKDELWAAGKSLLAQQGLPAAQCGSFVGKLVKDYGPEIVHAAVLAAVVERPADAVSFLKASCMARKGEGGKTLIPWHATDAGVTAKGAELGLTARPGETAIQFKARVIEAVDNGGKPPAVRASPAVTVQGELQRVAVDNSPEAKAKRSEALKAALKKEAA